MKARLFSLCILLTLALGTGCEKSLIDDGDLELGSRNYMMRFDYNFNGLPMRTDTIFTLGADVRFKIEDVNFLISNAFGARLIGDTIFSDKMFTWTTLKETDYLIGFLPVAAYNGHLGFTFGLDTVSNFLPPTSFPKTVLAQPGMYLDFFRGYRFIRVKGAAFDPQKPEEQTPSLPFDYVVAGSEFALTVSQPRSFVLDIGKTVVYTGTLDIGSLFDGLNPVQFRAIASDPTNPADFARATTMANAFKARGFSFN
jgi:hypothetical protein